MAGVIVQTMIHAATFEEQFCTIVESELDGIIIEILINARAAIMPSAERLRAYRPGVFHPAALVNVVDVKIAERAAARPEKAVESLHLVEQLADVCRSRAGFEGTDRPV